MRFNVAIVTITILSIILSIGVLAQIQVNQSTGSAPLTINFSSEENASTYAWDFNNDRTIDSTASNPTYTFIEAGSYLTTLQTDNGSYNITITVTEPTTQTPAQQTPTSTPSSSDATQLQEITVAATASTQTGNIPLLVQFTAISATSDVTYTWDFNGDNKVDSILQNPSFTYEKAGSYNVTVTAISGKQSAVKIIPITTTEFNSNLILISYFPKNVKQGENHITFIIQNNGSEMVNDISSKVIATGLQYASSSSINELRPQDQDSLTAVINVIQPNGTISGVVKIADKTFPISLEISAQTIYNATEITTRLDTTKKLLDSQEKIYTEKKSQGFLVQEIYDSIKSAKNKIQDTEQQVLTNKLAEADVNLNLLDTMITDIRENLQDAVKQEVTALTWIKDNAVAIAAVIAALGTISGFAIKATKSVKTSAEKLGDSVKQKMSKDNNNKPSETKSSANPEPTKEADK